MLTPSCSARRHHHRRSFRLLHVCTKGVGLVLLTVFLAASVRSAFAQTKMYWTDRDLNQILTANLDGSGAQVLFGSSFIDPEGIAVDPINEMIYFTNRVPARIYRMNFDGSGLETLVTISGGDPEDIELDIVAGKMYWSDDALARVYRANLDGSDVEVVVSGTAVADVDALALDICGKKIYWTDSSLHRIQRANFDGTNIETLLTTADGLSRPEALEVDPENGHLYFSDGFPGPVRIRRADTNGANVVTLVPTILLMVEDISLDIPGGKMYWTDRNTRKVQRADLDGTNVEDLYTSFDGAVAPFGIDLDLNKVTDLAVTKSVDRSQPFFGDRVTFTLTVTNNGPLRVCGAVINDVLPDGLSFVGTSAPSAYSAVTGNWTIGSLDVGASTTITITAQVVTRQVVTNTATITVATYKDDDHSNNTASVTLTPRDQQTFWRNLNTISNTVPALTCTSTSSGTTVFSGTEGSGVYRSLDGGANWFPSGLGGTYVRELEFGPSSVLWAATYGHGVFTSTDLGGNYTNVFSDALGQADNVHGLAINTFSPHGSQDDVFVGTESDGVWVTSDKGVSWTNITKNLGHTTILSLTVKKNGAGTNLDRVYAGRFAGGVWALNYTATSFASSWTNVSGGVLSNVSVYALAVDEAGNLFAGTDRGVYRSTNGGTSWTLVLDDVTATWDSPISARTVLIYKIGGTEYILVGTDGDYVYRAKTSDATNWTQFNGLTDPPNGTVSGLRSTTILDLAECSGKIYAGTGTSGIHKSEDNGYLWEQISDVSLQDGYRVFQALLYDGGTHGYEENRLYGGTYGFGVMMTEDLGSPHLRWTRVNNGLSNLWIYALALRRQGNAATLFAGTWNGGIFRSTDGAETWQFSGLPNRIVYDIAVDAGGIVYAATDRGEVARTHDNGITWQDIGVATTAIWSLGIDPATGTIYAGTFGGGIYKSEDTGFTWNSTGSTADYVYDFTFGERPDNGEYGIFAASARGVLFSNDDGDSWSVFKNNLGLTTPDSRAIAFAGDDLLVGTWGGGVFIYDDSVGEWVRDGFPGQEITVFAIDPDAGYVYVPTKDGLHARKYHKVSTSSELEEMPQGYSLSQNYPNPFNPTTTIEFSVPEPTHARLIVYDLLGRTVRLLADGPFGPGTHEVEFDAGDLSGGLYLYRLITPSQTLEKVMLLVK